MNTDTMDPRALRDAFGAFPDRRDCRYRQRPNRQANRIHRQLLHLSLTRSAVAAGVSCKDLAAISRQ